MYLLLICVFVVDVFDTGPFLGCYARRGGFKCGKPAGSGGLKPTPIFASLAVVLFAQNKRLPPHYAVNRGPVSSAVARALQMSSLLLYYWSQQEIPFWIAESASWVGASLLKQEGFARQESFAGVELDFPREVDHQALESVKGSLICNLTCFRVCRLVSWGEQLQADLCQAQPRSPAGHSGRSSSADPKDKRTGVAEYWHGSGALDSHLD